jgi:hypothetical protein
MKHFIFFTLLFASVVVAAQNHAEQSTSSISLSQVYTLNSSYIDKPVNDDKKRKTIRLNNTSKWGITKNKAVTGALVFLSGSAKGFNEALQFNYFGFESIFPKANDQWFYPGMSFKNKYKDGDPAKGPKFPLSTSVLVMFTDQYHLNNFIQRASLTAALVIKIGDGKKSFKHYVFDALYYTACYQAGFHSIYYPIKARSK